MAKKVCEYSWQNNIIINFIIIYISFSFTEGKWQIHPKAPLNININEKNYIIWLLWINEK